MEMCNQDTVVAANPPVFVQNEPELEVAHGLEEHRRTLMRNASTASSYEAANTLVTVRPLVCLLHGALG